MGGGYEILKMFFFVEGIVTMPDPAVELSKRFQDDTIERMEMIMRE